MAGVLSFAGRAEEGLAQLDIAERIGSGAAERSGEVTMPDELMRAADRALYAAKHAGRDRTATFDELSQHINLN